MAQKAVAYLSGKLHTKVSLKKVSIGFFNRASLEGLFVADHWNDTLLYAGELQVKVSDWFFLKDKPVVTFVGLKDAYVHIYRKDTSAVWNYQFVMDAFASGKKKEKKAQKPLQWDLKKLELQNVRFHNEDHWAGNDMIAEVGSLSLRADDIDFTKKEILLHSFNGDKVTFGLRDYASAKNYISKKGKVNSVVFDSTPFNPGLWKVSLQELHLKDSRFFLEQPDEPLIANEFDAAHMNVTGINLEAENLRIQADTLTGKMKLLQAKDRCGIEIKKMTADVTVSPVLSECKNLYLQTNRSIIGNYYAMHYKHFPDFTDYITNVKMVGNLKNATVSMKDIIYFAPEGLQRFNTMLAKVSGRVEGPVSDLHATDFNIDDGVNKIAGNFSITGLPDMSRTVMFLDDGNITTNAQGLLGYFPEMRTGNGFDLTSLGEINYVGNFKGLYNDFNITGSLNTSSGNLDVNLNLKNPETDHPVYNGHVLSNNFQLGKFLKQDNIGAIALNVDLEGTGFDPQTANAKINGEISSLSVNDYDYRNISVNGTLERKQFLGNVKTNDSNLKMLFDGRVDFSGEKPLFNLTSHIDYINVQKLNFTGQNIHGSGDVHLNFTGDNIDNFIGIASLNNIRMWKDSSLLHIDSLLLTSLINTTNEKELRLNTDGLDAIVAGNFSILDLPSSFQYFLSYYIPQYVKVPKQVNANQKFRYSVRFSGADDLLKLFADGLKISDGSELFGTMDMPAQQLTVNAGVPFIQYGSNVFNDITLSATGTNSNFHIEANAGEINSGSKSLLSSAQLRTNIFGDTAKFKIITVSSNSLGNAEMRGRAFADNGNFHLLLIPSEFYLSNTRWVIDRGNETIFGKDYIKIQNLVLNAGNQSVMINTLHDPSPNQAVVQLKNIQINAINDFIENDSLLFFGIANGSVEINPLLQKQVAKFNIQVDSLRMNEDTLGALHVAGDYDVDKSMLHFEEGTSLQYGDSKLSAQGYWGFDTTQSRSVNAVLHFENTRLSLAQPFLTGILHKIKGTVNGDINISGNTRRPSMSGLLKLQNAGFTPEITGVDYTLEDGDINVSDSKIDIGSIIIKDLSGNEGTLSGNATHQHLRNWRFNVRMNSDGIQALKLREGESDNFYGDVKAAVGLRLSGPVDDINITITATPLKNSKLFIPISNGIDLGEYNYIHFKNKNDTDSADKYVVSNSYHVRIDAVATPDLECTIILDKTTGDQIWAKGSGNLILEIPSQGDIRLNGNYMISDGRYDFAFKQLQLLNYKKQFQIYSGSVIKWNGDISNAELDVKAVAQVRARLYDLILNDINKLAITKDEIIDAQLKQVVNINMDMTGTLQAPQFGFKLDLAENRSAGTFAYQKLQRLNTDPSELFNQVASLLLLEQFLPPEGFNSTNTLSTAGANNLTELLSTFASSQLTNFTNKVLGIKDLYVGVRYKNYNLSIDNTDPIQNLDQIGLINRNEAGLNLRKNFFKDRLIVEVGGVYDWGQASGQNQFTTNLAGDFRVQYLLTEDGRVAASVFRTSNYDPVYQQNIGRQGIGLSYRKSFNNLYDFFQSAQRQREKQDEEMKQKSDTPGTSTPKDTTVSAVIITQPTND